MNKVNNKITIGMLLFTALPSLSQADVSVYGRVIYNMIKDDTSDDLYFGRHEFAESNFGLKASMDYGNVKFGAQIEIGLDEGVSNLLQTDNNSRTRIQEIWVDSTFGKIKMGTGESITWVIGDVDQSGTWLSDPLGQGQRFGATRRGPSGESQTPLIQSQSIFNERMVYESPKFLGGAKLYAQLGEAGSYEAAIKYLANGWRINVWGADYGDTDRDDDTQANIDGNATSGFFGAERGYGVLAGYKHTSGVNFTATYGTSELVDGGENALANWKLGYTRGKHAVSVSMGNYMNEDDAGIEGADHTRTTLAYNFKPLGGIQLWAQTTLGETDDQEDFNSTALGGMIKF